MCLKYRGKTTLSGYEKRSPLLCIHATAVFVLPALQVDTPDIDCLYFTLSSNIMNNKEVPCMSSLTPISPYRTSCPLKYSYET